MPAITNFTVIIITSIVLYYAGKHFTTASSRVGDYFHIPRSVKGATLDAISSSLPEFLIALFSVIFFHTFEVGVGTIVGSALFNILIIPGICILVSPKPFKISLDVLLRDGLFYSFTASILLAVVLFVDVWLIGVPLILIGLYFIYAYRFIKDTNTHRVTVAQKKGAKEINIHKELGIITLTVLITAAACYFLVEHAILLAEAIGIHPIIISFTIIAAASSVPDTIISFLNAKKGDIDDATSNVFGSNIFDISIGLGVPALIAILIHGPISIDFTYIEMIVGLISITIFIAYLFGKEKPLSKKYGLLFLLFYGVFLIYNILLSNGTL